MASGGTRTDIENIRRRYRLLALVGMSGDLVVIAALWLVDILPQDTLIFLTALLLAGATTTTYLLVKVLPDRVANEKGLASTERAGKE